MTAKDDQAKKPEGWPMAEELGEQAAMIPQGYL
jgi:hypothetical protein